MEPHEERLFRFRSDWAGVRKRISTADDFDWPRLCLLAEFVAWTESRLITGDLDEGGLFRFRSWQALKALESALDCPALQGTLIAEINEFESEYATHTRSELRDWHRQLATSLGTTWPSCRLRTLLAQANRVSVVLFIAFAKNTVAKLPSRVPACVAWWWEHWNLSRKPVNPSVARKLEQQFTPTSRQGMIRFASLVSGASDGNAYAISIDGHTILIDADYSRKNIEDRLERSGLNPYGMMALSVTHEHADHIKGVPALSNKYDIPIYLTQGTSEYFRDRTQLNIQGSAFEIPSPKLRADLKDPPPAQVRFIPVRHSAKEPVTPVVTIGPIRIGIVSDLGETSQELINVCHNANILCIESNYEGPEEGRAFKETRQPYWGSIQSRIEAGEYHLTNYQALAFARQVVGDKTQFVIWVHPSPTNDQQRTLELAAHAPETVILTARAEPLVLPLVSCS